MFYVYAVAGVNALYGCGSSCVLLVVGGWWVLLLLKGNVVIGDGARVDSIHSSAWRLFRQTMVSRADGGGGGWLEMVISLSLLIDEWEGGCVPAMRIW